MSRNLRYGRYWAAVFVWPLLCLISLPTSASANQEENEFCQISEARPLAEKIGAQSRNAGIKLLTNRRSAGAGEEVRARLANFSDTYVSYGAEFKIQRFDGTEWHTDPSSPDGPWPRSARRLKPGGVGGCYRYVVPEGQPAGKYRFLVSIYERTERYSRSYRKIAEFLIRNHHSRSCPRATEVDYEAPLADLPPLPPNTSRNDLGIGPPRLRLNGVGDALHIEKGEFGFQLAIDRRTIRRPVALEGVTELELDRVDRRGRVVETVAVGRRSLGVVASPGFNGKSFLVGVPAKPGLFRFQAHLRDAQGKAVGRYVDYLRVVRPVTDVRLIVSGQSVRPGNQISFWIENRGTREVDPLGAAYAFEVFEGGVWSNAPSGPRVFPKSKNKPLIRSKPLTAGKAGGCLTFQIPSDASPGLYRFSKDVVLESGARRQLTAEFEVSSE